MASAEYMGAIDQGTTSTRFVVVDRDGRIVAADQREHRQSYPRPGWVEHDPGEIVQRTNEVIAGALGEAGLTASDLAGVGITNQRETVVVWDRETGEALADAIVWQDTRTGDICRELVAEVGKDEVRRITGLPVSTYFSGPKIAWLLDHLGLEAKAQAGEVAVGTIDSWLMWNLTDGAHHVTDVTNASRTLMMDLDTLAWDDRMCDALGVPRHLLGEIRSSSEVYGEATGLLAGVPLAGILGDQQAALFGQTCFEEGEGKSTYGTGNFLLVNTGTDLVRSSAGLITTVAHRLGEEAPRFALEGSIAVTGALVQWLRDNLGVIGSSAEVEELAGRVEDSGDVYFVPAFSGLFAPRWRPDARGVVVGLTGYAGAAHLARAALEATAFQTREVVDAMTADAGLALSDLRVDGGMVENQLLMQFQADILGIDVVRPTVTETTVLGAAYAAGLAVGFWSGVDELRGNWVEDRRWRPAMGAGERDARFARWNEAVERSLGWAE